MNVSKGGLQRSHSKNKKVFDLLIFFKQMSNPMNPEIFDATKKLMKFSITRDKTLKKSVSSLKILIFFKI